MVKIGAIWKQTKEDGTVYFKGRIDFPAAVVLSEGTEVLLFRSKSEHEKAPYFDLLIAKPRPKQEAKPTSKAASEYDDDIPF